MVVVIAAKVVGAADKFTQDSDMVQVLGYDNEKSPKQLLIFSFVFLVVCF